MSQISADLLLSAYLQGVFPMADQDGGIFWYNPDPRAIIPIDSYKPSKSLRPILNQNIFEIKFNSQFVETMRSCALPRKDEPETWISDELIEVYTELHDQGFAHSVEAWQNGELVGGLYGVSISGVFFGESMFYKKPNASKVAFHFLIKVMQKQGMTLLDTQFMNDNVKRYGAIEIPRKNYLLQLTQALDQKVKFLEKLGEVNLCELNL